jgi:nucleoside-diphosphate-sugar epimerase
MGDLQDETALAELVEGSGTVYHCAAEMGKGDPSLSHRVNVVGTENLARAALRAGVERFVYVSSISVYGATPRDDGTITEDKEPEGTDFLNPYSATKYGGEVAVRDLAREGGMSFTIIRPTNVYGPHSKPWFLQFERLLKWVPLALGDLPIDVVYVDDVAEGMIMAAASPAGANKSFNLGHEMVKLNRFILEVARVTHRRAWKLPVRLDALLRRVVSRAYEYGTGKPLSMPLLEPTYFPHSKARNAFGYSPRVKLPEGFDRLAEWVNSGRP